MNARPSATATLFSLVVDVVLTNILLQFLLLMLYLGCLGFLVLFLLLFLDPVEWSSLGSMVRGGYWA